MENSIMEIPWIDEIMWISWDNYAQLMVKFKEFEKIAKKQKLIYIKN